jgi:signal transduction histidine kinase
MRVRVSARAEEGAVVRIEVSDEGAGMDDDQLARLFEPFGSKKVGGTGFGMLVIRKIVHEGHAGRSRWTARRGRGRR